MIMYPVPMGIWSQLVRIDVGASGLLLLLLLLLLLAVVAVVAVAGGWWRC